MLTVGGSTGKAAAGASPAQMPMVQVEQAAADVKVRETAVARREGDLSRQEAATLSGSADAIKREAEVAAREQALTAQLAEVKAAEAQLQEKKLETKKLQVSKQGTCGMVSCCDYMQYSS